MKIDWFTNLTYFVVTLKFWRRRWYLRFRK